LTQEVYTRELGTVHSMVVPLLLVSDDAGVTAARTTK
jgi:hypothetical protein